MLANIFVNQVVEVGEGNSDVATLGVPRDRRSCDVPKCQPRRL